MTALERWHEIHDAYVAFFGDDHRPAAVAFADREARRPDEISRGPGAIIPIRPGGKVEYLAPPTNYPQVLSDLHAHRYELQRALLYGDA